MIALSVRQPWADVLTGGPQRVRTSALDLRGRDWASAIPRGLLQDVVNRSQSVDYGDPVTIAIHAPSKPWDDWLQAAETIRRITGVPVPHWQKLVYGAVVGVVTMPAAHHAVPGCCASAWADPAARAHWSAVDHVRLEEPVPAKGQVGVWTLPRDVEAAVRAQIPPVERAAS